MYNMPLLLGFKQMIITQKATREIKVEAPAQGLSQSHISRGD